MNILMVLTSHEQLGDTGNKTGFWLEELASPYYIFQDVGANITLASPKGARPPMDPESDKDLLQAADNARFKSDARAMKKLANTTPLVDISAADYDAVFYPGGHGPLWDLAESKLNIALIEAFHLLNKPIAAVCHGPAVFRHTRANNGKPLIANHRITGISRTELAALGLSSVVPFQLEDMLKHNEANYERADNWKSFVVQDGLLITGQNPASSTAVARTLVSKLKSQSAKEPFPLTENKTTLSHFFD